MINFKTISFYSKIKKQLWVIFLIWTVVVLFSLGWNISRHNQMIEDMALLITRTAFEKDILYRQWVAGHGGVYTAVDETTPPNPYLDFLLMRDFLIDEKEYTLINPAYMTRQVFDLQSKGHQIYSHITSLDPVNPKNAAFPYEVNALNAFNNGQDEYYEILTIDGQDMFFYVKALILDESCMGCHEQYGDQVGHVQGGISQMMALNTLRSIFHTQYLRFFWMHLLFYITGILGLTSFYHFLRLNVSRQLSHEKELFKLGFFDALTGLHSRSYFEHFRNENKNRQMVSLKVVYFDVDGLKQVNDQLGHAAGDDLLQRAATVIRQTFRDEDIKVRLSGDEFVVVLLNANISERELTTRLNHYIRANNQIEINKPHLDISYGFANVMGFQKLGFALQQADAAMYQQKQAKKTKNSPFFNSL